MSNRILCVGLTCLDVISYAHQYPIEDSDNRMDENNWALGGNAANNVTVLRQLGDEVVLFSALPDENSNDPSANIAMKLIRQHDLNVIPAIRRNEKLPVSTVIVSLATGTRTILHARNDFKEITFEEFKCHVPNITRFAWIHFEGRNFDNVKQILEYCNANRLCTKPILSVEVEKVRPSPLLEQLIPLADVVFASKDFARKHQCLNAEDAVCFLLKTFSRSDATVICAWGEQGAVAGRKIKGEFVIFKSPAYNPPSGVIDTLGAGDTFVATSIHCLNKDYNDLDRCLQTACKVAGHKCSKRGLTKLDIDVLLNRNEHS